ncbi:MAG TPA: DUF3368 domain-containing protein [Verrucomicrobiae bacterium]|jgi:predicted nucleic acid-binding protein
MVVIVSDTSPINYLVLCKAIHVLPTLYDRIIVPPSVHAELSNSDAPSIVREWAAKPPTWLTIKSPIHIDQSLPLDPGESEAICLAQEIHADALIVDESAARQHARERGLRVTGTIGVLELAASKNLLRLSEALASLRETNFHASETLLQQALERDQARRRTNRDNS